jgi:hypothetical protein
MKSYVHIIRFLFAILLFAAVQSVSAQQQPAMATIDSSSILIGDHVHLKVSWEIPGNANVQWPVFGDTLTGKIEVVKVGKMDSVQGADGKSITLSQTLTLTCFDSGSFYIPAIPFAYTVPGDTTLIRSMTSPMLLNVNTVKVDTTQAIKAIKQPLKAPWTLREILTWAGIGLGIAAVLFFIVFALVRILRKKPVFGGPVKEALPPHLRALKELEELRVQLLWQKGREKDYHSRLSDIIRTYIEGRFRIAAPEMITPEVLDKLGGQAGLSKEVLAFAEQLLRLADMVKFARYQPLPDEHDLCMRNAVGFVEGTTEMTGTMNSKEDAQ